MDLEMSFVFLFLFFAGYLLTVKTNKKLSNILFALFLIVTAFDVSAFFYHKFLSVSYTFEMLRTQILGGLKEPLFYLYMLSVIYDNFKLKGWHLLLLLPIVVSLIILFPDFFSVSVEKQQFFYNNYNAQPEIKWITILGYILLAVYFIAEVYQVIRYGRVIKQNYSNANALVNYTWLKQFLIIISIGTAITIVKNTMKFNTSNADTIEMMRIFTLLFGVLFMSWLFSKALLAPKVFQGIDASIELISKKKTVVKDERVEKIQAHMQTEEPFLDASLTLQKLARQVEIPSRELSELINQQIGKHFFDFVNEYRIEKAKKLLTDTSKNKLTVLEILYEVGFNSKSSFNTVFKKHVGLTPTKLSKLNS